MSENWKPGDVATLGGLPITFFKNEDRDELMFTNNFGYQHPVRNFAPDARRLVVIDPENREQVERLIEGLRTSGAWRGIMTKEVAYAGVSSALREFANPTPPKPEEPTGLGAVVEDGKGGLWFRMSLENQTWPGEVWQEQYGDADRWSKWESVAAVRVLSEGVTA